MFAKHVAVLLQNGRADVMPVENGILLFWKKAHLLTERAAVKW